MQHIFCVVGSKEDCEQGKKFFHDDCIAHPIRLYQPERRSLVDVESFTVGPWIQEEIDAELPHTEDESTCADFPPVLDACCGSRAFWFDKADPRCLYVDNFGRFDL